jgi:hypothetical protein
MKKLWLSFWAIIFITGAMAQGSNSIWQTVQAPVKLSEKLIWHNDAGYRTVGYSWKARNVLYRTGLRYQFSKKTDAAAGIALFYQRTDRAEQDFAQEFRLWQEVVRQQQVTPYLSLQLRLRTEQRFFAATSQPGFTAYRFRYRANVIGKLHKNLFLQVGYEHMHQLANQHVRFNQLRIQPALLYNISSKVQIQAMYMYLQTPDDIQRILWLTYFIHLSYANKNRHQS